MTLIRWSPFLEPINEMENFLSDYSRSKNAGFIPSLDIYQDKNNIIVESPLAGIDPEEMNISIENDVLTIEGRSEKQSEVDDKEYYRKEVRYGIFHRSVALPIAVNGQEAKAEYHDGLLKIIIPKQERVKPKSVKIEIKNKDKK